MLREKTLFETIDKIKISIDRLKAFGPEEGYHLAFSGGKDSIVIYELAKMAGVKFESRYNITTVDPPELIYFIRENYSDVERLRPEISMWDLIVKKKFPPTRIQRYCCEYLKERRSKGKQEFLITGVRAAESAKRAKRKYVETCYRHTGTRFLHPIIDWTEKDVWQFIKERNLKYCKLYDEGFKRLGCIGCPIAGKNRIFEFEKYPKFKKLYIRAFDRMLIARKESGLENKKGWKTGQDVFNWWVQEKYEKIDERQLLMFD